VQIVDGAGQVVAQQQYDEDIRVWLPEAVYPMQLELVLPPTLEAGVYDLRLAFVYADTQEPALSLAIEGQDAEGYYRPGSITVLP
jgi:hypothetical protein